MHKTHTIPPPHTCTCGGPLAQESELVSENFYQVNCRICRSVFVAPKHEAARQFLATHKLEIPADEMNEKRRLKNRQKRRRRKLARRLEAPAQNRAH